MHRARPRLIVAMAFVASAACTVQAGRAEAWCRMTTSNTRPPMGSACVTEGIPLAWHRACISIAIDQRGLPDMPLNQLRSIISTSFGVWQAIDCGGFASTGPSVQLDSQLSYCSKAEYKSGSGNVNTIAFIDNWSDLGYDPAAFALTTVWHNKNTGDIYDADMQINNQQGPYTVLPRAEWLHRRGPRPGRPTERGHPRSRALLRDGAPADPEATMYYSAGRGEVKKRDLSMDDTDGYCAIYPPGFLGGTCDFTPRGGEQLDCEHNSCGCSAPGAASRRGAWGGSALAMIALTMLVGRRRRRPPVP